MSQQEGGCTRGRDLEEKERRGENGSELTVSFSVSGLLFGHCQPPKCYCHICSSEVDVRYVVAGKGELSTAGWVG
jgi:hypothetical protein